MKTRISPLRALFCLVVALGSMPVMAEPCELNRNALGAWFGDCLLEDYTKQLVYFPAAPIFQMPDLSADDADYLVNGRSVTILARTKNDSIRDSNDYEVTAQVTISGGGMTPQMVTISGRSQPHPAGVRQWTYVGVVTIPDRISDYDLSVTLLVDSLNMTTGGEIWEMDETNNSFNDGTCRVFGKNPDTSVQACN